MTNAKFEKVPIRENNEPMAPLTAALFVVQPMYNLLEISNTRQLFLRAGLVTRLVDVQERHLAPLARRFKIWDGWRSREVQNQIYRRAWNDLEREHPGWSSERLAWEVGTFVTEATDASRIPPHATGGSVDLTVVDSDGDELDFGTKFDHFGPEAASNYYEYQGANTAARDNRRWLRQVLSAGGLVADEDEWWHFDYGNQKWALQSAATHAFYGEVCNPSAFSDNRGP